jgi:serpin B
MKTIIPMLLAFLLVSVNSCQKNDVEPEKQKFIQLDEKSAQLVEADNAFGLELFQKIREESDEENLMVSPLSVSVALAMAYNGAGGDTKKEMEETLKLNGLTPEQINASYQSLISVLQSLDKDVVFEVANAIFYADVFSIKQNFLDINKNVYDAEVESLDFSSSEAVGTINNWVAEKTHDKIKSIIDQLSPLDRMVLLNAIYFYGTWTNEFDENGTHNLPFHKTDGTTLEVPTMSKFEKLPYFSTNLFKAIKMPYGNGQYNMVVLLPVDGQNSQDIIEALSVKNWKNWQASFKMTDRVEITMPRFKYAFETKLKKVLRILGMQKAFDEGLANFSGIADEDLYISEAIHKSYIDVNETGTEAAAVTGLVFTTTGVGNEPPSVPFYVDRPFVYAITENDTGAILFMGEVNHPEYD